MKNDEHISYGSGQPALERAAREVLDTELADLACTGSDAAAEHALGMLQDALNGQSAASAERVNLLNAIDGLMDFAPSCTGGGAGMVRGGEYIKKSEVVRAIRSCAAPVAQEPVDFEHRHAIKQGERNGAEDKYFEARPEFDNKQDRRLFCDGFDRGYEAAPNVAPVAAQLRVTDEMVTRFLGWHLPQDFVPDCGISFKPLGHPNGWPVGTNLFTDPQARAMLEYVLSGVQK